MTTDNLQPATSNSLRIRPATPDDIPQILAFIRELADYEREPAAAVATHADLLRDGFTEPKRFHCLIAEVESLATDNLQPATSNFLPAGFALYFFNYSTWRGHAGIYLEDLFVRPQYRGKGIGKALLARVAAIAVAEGCPRFEWAVLNWNTPAIDFYNAIGAVPMSEWTTMRLAGDALQQLGQ
jgi:GNAT superfamily N-acetyltransferase